MADRLGQPISQPQLQVTDDLGLLLDVLPPRIRLPLEALPDQTDLLEVVMDLGRLPEARLPGREVMLAEEPVTVDDIDHVIGRIGQFGDDNRAGIERTLHRISAIRSRDRRVIGLTCRVGRAVYGTISIIRDLVESGSSVLMMGRPGVGKTTMLREAARVLADDLRKRTIIVDTSNEIGGDGDIPHPAIGRSRRMQVPTPTAQHGVMIEAVENHMPEVIVIDEIGTELEAQAARTIAERGVQLIATAHGNTLENLMLNPTLADLIGGIQTVTLGDEEARRRGTQKSVLERKAPPTFDVVVEIQNWNRVAVHENVADVIDALLRGHARPAAIRYRDDRGEVQIEKPPPRRAGPPQLLPTSDGEAPAPTPFGRGRVRDIGERDRDRDRAPDRPRERTDGERAPRLSRDPEPGTTAGNGKTLALFAYGVNRSRTEQMIRAMHLPVVLTDDPNDADVVMTLKNYYRRKPQPLRDAEANGTPIHVLRGNSGGQIEEGLSRIAQMDRSTTSATTSALQETEDAIAQVLEETRPIELSPQSAYVRRLQHQLAERYNLGSRSLGREPYRRVQLFPRDFP
ncbi:MAG: AAA family ATPase [Chloroflexi bacterium]|nr:AAA family ATPase [Chloroflexota bacterium]